tara:strand:- start:104 stop:337 length:234 start_codon:yes stop_codon:yes gene_type:complete
MKESMGYAQHNPNAGENQVHYSGNSADASGSKGMDSAGVVDGLSTIAKCDVKDYEGVTQNQRPEAMSMTSGSYKIGT